MMETEIRLIDRYRFQIVMDPVDSGDDTVAFDIRSVWKNESVDGALILAGCWFHNDAVSDFLDSLKALRHDSSHTADLMNQYGEPVITLSRAGNRIEVSCRYQDVYVNKNTVALMDLIDEDGMDRMIAELEGFLEWW